MSISKNVHGLIGLCLAIITAVTNAAEVNVLTDRTDFHLKPILKQFELQTGTKVNAIYVNEGSLPTRLAAKPDEADLIVTTDSAVLTYAKEKGWTKPIGDSAVVDSVRSELRDGERNYVALSFRSRVLVYSPERVDVTTLTGYEDLADPKFKGRVCTRPLNHVYNISLVSQMLSDRGEAWVKAWLKGLTDNLAVKPTGNDRKQAQLIADGVCDIAVMNSYYFGLMQTNNTERFAASKVRLFFPNQRDAGSYVLTSGAAITKSAKNTKEAVQLIEYLLSPIGQSFVSNVNFEYPVIDHGFELPKMVQSFGESQPGISKGVAKFDFVSPNKIAKNREAAIQMLSTLK